MYCYLLQMQSTKGQAMWTTNGYGQRVLWEDEKEETTWKTLAQMGRQY
jgi:hypothetical protein